MSKIVVIGGGVVGLCSAYYLAKDGHQVTVIDRAGFTDGASWGNAGMIVPSHFEPLANPGMLSLGLKMLFQPGAPLGFQGIGMALGEWMWQFYRAASPEHTDTAAPIIRDLNLFSRQCYADLKDSQSVDFSFDPSGLLMVCRTEKGFDGERRAGDHANRLGIRTRNVGRAELEKLGYSGAGGVLFENDAHIVSAEFLSAMIRTLRGLGVALVSGDVETVETREYAVHSVTLQSGDQLTADTFVLAAGAWSGKVAAKLGLKMPLMPGRGYGFEIGSDPGSTNPPQRGVGASAILVEARIATSPGSKGRRFTGAMEIGAWDSGVTQNKLETIRRAIPEYVPSLECHDFNEPIWNGHRPCSPDGMPYLGRFARCPNLIAATGHGMMGMSLGPATGQIVASLARHEQPAVSIALCRPDRYS